MSTPSLHGSDSGPKLSICIPTHHGRARTLGHLLTEIGRQLDGLSDEVEVCVSDNASCDGTDKVVERHAATLGCRLRYRRNESDVRLRNLACVTELASGRFCWLFGSDDAPGPGALRAVLELIDSYPDAGGFQLGIRRLTRDMSEPIDLMPAEAFPAERETTTYTGATEIARALGWLQLCLSLTVVRRDLWQAVVREEPHLFRRHRDFPQAYVLGRVAQRRPLWVWCPRLLVDSRSGQLYLDEPGEIGSKAPRQWQMFHRQLDRVWADLHGRFSATYRVLLYRLYRLTAIPAWICGEKSKDDHKWKDDARVLSSALVFWWMTEFRRASLRWLLLPHRAFKAGRGWSWALGGGQPLPPAACRTVISVPSLPPLTAGYQSLVSCSVENRGPATLSSRMPHPVRLAARWFDGEGRFIAQGPRTPLLPSLRSGERRTIAVRIDPPFEAGEYELRITAVQELVVWFDDLDAANGWAGTVAVKGT